MCCPLSLQTRGKTGCGSRRLTTERTSSSTWRTSKMGPRPTCWRSMVTQPPSVRESQPPVGGLPWALDTRWNDALRPLPNKVPNLSPVRIPKFEKSYLKRFEYICKIYGLDSQSIIDLRDKGRLPALAQKGSREGRIAAWCAWHRQPENWDGSQGEAQQATDVPLSSQITATMSQKGPSRLPVCEF